VSGSDPTRTSRLLKTSIPRRIIRSSRGDRSLAPPLRTIEAPAEDAPEDLRLRYFADDGFLQANPAFKSAEGFRLFMGRSTYPSAREFIESQLWIVTKKGRWSPLVLNEAQSKLEDLYAEKGKSERGFRAVVLKARQEGVSTWTQAHLFEACSRTPNTEALTVAHRNKASDKIFAMSRRFLRKLRFRPVTKYLRRSEIEFDEPIGSRMGFDSAENEDLGRAGTIRMLHLSELAFWPNPEPAFLSVASTCPMDPGTFVVIESTANGMGGFFYDFWEDSKKGKTEFIPVFLPWFALKDYAMVVSEERRREILASLDPEERELVDRHKVAPEQLEWRRFCIAANCRGSVDLFHQEYPANDREAFLPSGTPVFDGKRLQEVEAGYVGDPLYRAEIALDPDGTPRIQKNVHGELCVWEPPQDGDRYVIGIDSAEGTEGGSRQGVHVMELKSCRQVAEFSSSCDTMAIGDVAVALGRYYHGAFLVPESNYTGIAVLNRIRDRGYSYFYIEILYDRVSKTWTKRLGWRTTSATRPLMIAECQENLQEFDPGIRSRELLSEMFTFVRGTSSPHAKEGRQDDLLFARMLALMGRKSIYFPEGRGPRANEEEKQLDRLPLEDRDMWRAVYAAERKRKRSWE